MRPSTVPVLSVVAPIHNEQEVIALFVREVAAVLAAIGESYEIVLVDDGSSDSSWDELVKVAASNRGVRVVRLSRNFGHQAAISAGIEAARGDAVITMDGDLQHPPDAIEQLVARWREGYDVVYAYRESREGDSVRRRAATAVFYRALERMTQPRIPRQAGDFRLVSRRVADLLVAMPERARFLRGMATWVGFRQTGVPYQQQARAGGTASYSVARLAKLAGDGIFSFSTTPLRALTTLGLSVSFLSFLYLVYTVYERVFTNSAPAGWASVVVVVVLFGGIQLMSLGLLGQYVARIFEETKGRPLFVVSDELDAEPVAGETPAEVRQSPA